MTQSEERLECDSASGTIKAGSTPLFPALSGDVSNAVGTYSVSLASVLATPPSNALVKITADNKGRVIGTSTVVAGDLSPVLDSVS